jgi:starch phosphorylase
MPPVETSASVAFFSMEIALDEHMPTYAGGLGVLAGDTLRSAADLGLPMVGLTLLHRKGYFRQRLDDAGRQHEDPVDWPVERFVLEQAPKVRVTLEQRPVTLRAWRYEMTGTERSVPVYLLDADLPENSAFDRTLTHFLYGGDDYYRLCQEIVLGIGGVRMLRALGYDRLQRFHMNEGHSSLLAIELLSEHVGASARTSVGQEDLDAVRRRCIFTTHTPVPSGQDQFSIDLARRVLGDSLVFAVQDRCCADGRLNLTYLGLNFSHYVNGVAMRHGQESRKLFGGYPVDAITNGVHAATWTCPELQILFDRHIPGWRRDNFSLRYALSITRAEIWTAHAHAKQRLLDAIAHRADVRFQPDVFTLGFARRATAYKRADLLLHDLDRLRTVGERAGRLQVVYAGKAHPHDGDGKAMIETIHRAKSLLSPHIPIVYLQDYDIDLARLLTAGVDLWLNTPLPPLEASGTSGMKAALNGVPSLSVLDGWWIEGHMEGVTGWAIGEREPDGQLDRTRSDAASLYDQLERVIMPMFYSRRDDFVGVMRHAIAMNGSFFNSHRMVEEYVLKAYVP